MYNSSYLILPQIIPIFNHFQYGEFMTISCCIIIIIIINLYLLEVEFLHFHLFNPPSQLEYKISHKIVLFIAKSK